MRIQLRLEKHARVHDALENLLEGLFIPLDRGEDEIIGASNAHSITAETHDGRPFNR